MNDQQDAITAAMSVFDLDGELLDRLRDRLAGMSDIHLPHGAHPGRSASSITP